MLTVNESYHIRLYFSMVLDLIYNYVITSFTEYFILLLFLLMKIEDSIRDSFLKILTGKLDFCLFIWNICVFSMVNSYLCAIFAAKIFFLSIDIFFLCNRKCFFYDLEQCRLVFSVLFCPPGFALSFVWGRKADIIIPSVGTDSGNVFFALYLDSGITVVLATPSGPRLSFRISVVASLW